jgi:hypothetical protein
MGLEAGDWPLRVLKPASKPFFPASFIMLKTKRPDPTKIFNKNRDDEAPVEALERRGDLSQASV